MRKALALGTVAASLVGMAVAAVPASAADTAVNFTITGGGLSLTVPTNPAVTLNSGTLSLGAASVTAPLNATTVTDERGAVAGNWKVQVSSTAFAAKTSGNPAIPNSAGDMYIDVAATTLGGLTSGIGLLATTAATQATPANLATPGTGAVAPTLIAGTTAIRGSLTYTPTLRVTIPVTAAADAYSGTVTQTAS